MDHARDDAAAKAAADAYRAGRHVLTFKIVQAGTNSRSTGIMPGVGEQIEAIEAQGWYLDKMSAEALGGERTALICLFRRRP
ncbi:hypothetical protein [Streptomyces sp. NPDC051546]|uniref:hypothetical protein n=1 Tax=Streptomyces sp. NPDC051546 TaxID=3365655 RepID=UPI00379DD872